MMSTQRDNVEINEDGWTQEEIDDWFDLHYDAWKEDGFEENQSQDDVNTKG